MSERDGEDGRLLRVITFDIEDETYGIDILSVFEVIRPGVLTRIPNADPRAAGVINLRGQVIPVLDLRKSFGLSSASEAPERRVIVVETSSGTCGLLVDRVHEVVELSGDVRRQPHDLIASVDESLSLEIAILDNQVLLLLQPEKLTSSMLLESAVV